MSNLLILVNRNRFEFLDVIGRGGFGKVWKVFDKKFKKYYALKEISKVKVIDKKSISTIKYERELLCHLNHPLIINLHYAFQDFHNLYFVLDLLTGGDLRYQLGHHPRRYFSEQQTKFFIACIVESLFYIHNQNIIHRDIKPENLIFDERGYLHVTDFGIAKFSTNNNLNETSGTPGYMAPEVMRGLNHTGSVDYFAVGVITYELMFGRRPYLGKTRKEIKEQMMIKQIFLDEESIPRGWSQYAADFINRLLIRKDSSRLGFYNDLEVKRHPWLSSINFEDLVNCKIISPFLPRRNHDNYDKKYCQEIEEIGIDTNLRYEDYRNHKRYMEIFEGFTFYNVDESQLLQYNEIYKKPSVKYMKNNLNLNNNNDYLRKSKTINVDYDYKNKNNLNLTPKHNKILSSNKNQNLSSYKNRSNISNRTINYSNADNSTNRKTPRIYLDYKQNSSIKKVYSKSPLKNGEDIYIMASPIRRGRISINSNDYNLDNSFRKYANHSFVETNYSKGRILRRSYSSSNIHNSNYFNIFNLLINNVNNINSINNNNVVNNNDSSNSKNIYRNYSKLLTPISYNKINKGRIPYDRRANSNYKNYNNYNINNDNYHHRHNRSFIEKPKNYSFYFVENENSSFNYNNNFYKDNYNNYSNFNNFNNYNNYNNKSSTYRYRNKEINDFNLFFNEPEKKSYTIRKEIDKYKELSSKNNDYYIKGKIPIDSIRKIIPINLKDKNIANNSRTINVDNPITRRPNNINYNKIKNIDYVNINNIPNNSLYIDKYKKNNFIQEEIKNNNQKQKEGIKILNYKMDDKIKSKGYNNNNIHQNRNQNLQQNQSHLQYSRNLVIEKNINKRNTQVVKKNNSYGNININSMNNNLNNLNYNRNINNSNNEKNKKEKKLSYKKIPIPLPLSKTSKKTKLEIIENNNDNNKVSISKINIINNNIINNNIINNAPINYNCINKNAIDNKNIIKNKNNNNCFKNKIDINENSNNSFNINKNQTPTKLSINNKQININNYNTLNIEKKDIISMKINEKAFCQYKYLENFNNYKKIKNINERNKNKYINKENNNKICNSKIKKKKLKI